MEKSSYLHRVCSKTSVSLLTEKTDIELELDSDLYKTCNYALILLFHCSKQCTK